MSDNDIEIRGHGVTYNRTVSSNVSGINVYYNFDNFGYMSYSNTAKRMFYVIGVQSSHPAGGIYYKISAYYLHAANDYSGGWKEVFEESNALPARVPSTSTGHFRTGSTYNASLSENYASSTYTVAWQLAMGGSGTANSGWNGWGVEITSYP